MLSLRIGQQFGKENTEATPTGTRKVVVKTGEHIPDIN